MKVIHSPGYVYNYWSVTDESFDYWTTHEEIMQWCTEHFGHPTYKAPEAGQPGWSKFRDTVTFNRQDDLTAFLLRWGE